MGVVMPTMCGWRTSARESASVLHAIRLDDCVGGSPDECFQMAGPVAVDVAKLGKLRQ